VDRFSFEEREAMLADVARRGLAATAAGLPVLDLAREFASLAADGLRRIAERGETEADERSFLDPVLEVLDRGTSPGEAILDSWRGEWKGSMDRLIEASEY
jgi:glutamate--cysteine ligase